MTFNIELTPGNRLVFTFSGRPGCVTIEHPLKDNPSVRVDTEQGDHTVIYVGGQAMIIHSADKPAPAPEV